MRSKKAPGVLLVDYCWGPDDINIIYVTSSLRHKASWYNHPQTLLTDIGKIGFSFELMVRAFVILLISSQYTKIQDNFFKLPDDDNNDYNEYSLDSNWWNWWIMVSARYDDDD